MPFAHGSYPASPLLWPPRHRTCSTPGYGFPAAPRGTTRTPGASQVPRPLSRYALSPTTPESSQVHMPVASLTMLASPSLTGWPLSALRFEAEPGSLSLRLAPCALQGFSAPVTRLTLPARLHVSQAFHMVNSFQFTREVRLSLTHQRRRGKERTQRAPRSPLRSLCFSASLRETAVRTL